MHRYIHTYINTYIHTFIHTTIHIHKYKLTYTCNNFVYALCTEVWAIGVILDFSLNWKKLIFFAFQSSEIDLCTMF